MNEAHSDKLLTTAELADLLKVSRQTVINWRAQKRGPKFLKFAHTVRYALDDVQEFLNSSKSAA